MCVIHPYRYGQRVSCRRVGVLQRTNEEGIVVVMQIDVRFVDCNLANRHFLTQQIAHAQLQIRTAHIRQSVALLVRDVDIVDMQGVEEPVFDVPNIDIGMQSLRHLCRQPAYSCRLYLAIAHKQRQHVHNHQAAYDEYRQYVRKALHE